MTFRSAAKATGAKVLNGAKAALAGARLDAKAIHCIPDGEFRAE